MRKFILAAVAAVLFCSSAYAGTVTITWTWPTARADSTALPLTAIAGFALFDTTVPVPGFPGTMVACAVTLPPTTATGTCTTGPAAGGNHSYVITINDNSTPTQFSVPSTPPATVTVPSSAPNPVTNVKAIAN